MREAALRVVDCLSDRSHAVGELADAIDKSQSWTSEVVSDLEDEHLVERNDGVRLANTYEATLLAEFLTRYTCEPSETKRDLPAQFYGFTE
nr:ArsR family transcriptional regulator [Salinirussus salinus]